MATIFMLGKTPNLKSGAMAPVDCVVDINCAVSLCVNCVVMEFIYYVVCEDVTNDETSIKYYL